MGKSHSLGNRAGKLLVNIPDKCYHLKGSWNLALCRKKALECHAQVWPLWECPKILWNLGLTLLNALSLLQACSQHKVKHTYNIYVFVRPRQRLLSELNSPWDETKLHSSIYSTVRCSQKCLSLRSDGSRRPSQPGKAVTATAPTKGTQAVAEHTRQYINVTFIFSFKWRSNKLSIDLSMLHQGVNTYTLLQHAKQLSKSDNRV